MNKWRNNWSWTNRWNCWEFVYIFNPKNSCEPEDTEWISRNAHRPVFQRPGFCRDCEIFEGILEKKNQIRKVLLHNYQIFLIDLILCENGYPVGPAFPSSITVRNLTAWNRRLNWIQRRRFIRGKDTKNACAKMSEKVRKDIIDFVSIHSQFIAIIFLDLSIWISALCWESKTTLRFTVVCAENLISKRAEPWRAGERTVPIGPGVILNAYIL